ncbi:abortive infection system antitoxin AbiGi family protein [Paenibacillus polymyxa]|uniref:Abortive infection system antitoxin AbiGi family protein n=1 Tax=Paenibacillus polymyxa TaxID=1406 RepID=A0AAE9L950_PAEPO|nr:abortive infection system antitoxin AbiGi family protein [Paenibacillus polymyxa]URJ41926.1 abortive infection system antitoxin AbiGi family protein [Paenibacillus polymyxa]URJ51860.1 abortive infection system antitoxin AbiGi family protein [Paenibacillus polymyxa]
MGNSTSNNEMVLKEAPQVNRESVPYRQSANVLFNFMPKLDYLKDKLRYKAMIPRYYEESVEYLDLEVIKKIAFPMVCFCDIHLNKLTYHMGDRNSHDGYGRYGIGMNKDWGITGGIKPISYMNDSSALLSDYKGAFTQALEQNNEGKGDEIIHNFMFRRKNGKIPRVPTKNPDVWIAAGWRYRLRPEHIIWPCFRTSQASGSILCS